MKATMVLRFSGFLDSNLLAVAGHLFRDAKKEPCSGQ